MSDAYEDSEYNKVDVSNFTDMSALYIRLDTSELKQKIFLFLTGQNEVTVNSGGKYSSILKSVNRRLKSAKSLLCLKVRKVTCTTAGRFSLRNLLRMYLFLDRCGFEIQTLGLKRAGTGPTF